MNGLLSFVAGLGSAIGIAWLYKNNPAFRQAAQRVGEQAQESAGRFRRAGAQLMETAESIASVDLNECSREELVQLGLSEELADRVLENRPYRNKLDLVARLVIPEDAYELIKQSIGVDDRSAEEPVKVAS